MYSSYKPVTRSESEHREDRDPSDDDFNEENDDDRYEEGEVVEDILGRMHVYVGDGKWIKERNSDDDYDSYDSSDDYDPRNPERESSTEAAITGNISEDVRIRRTSDPENQFDISQYLKHHYQLPMIIREMLATADRDKISINNWHDFVSMYLDCLLAIKMSTKMSSIDQRHTVIALCEEFLKMRRTPAECTESWDTSDGTFTYSLREVFDDLKHQYP